MAWAMASASGMMGQNKDNQTGYQDSTGNNAIGPAIPQSMQDFMGAPMKMLNDKIMADRQRNANRAGAAARIARQNMPMNGNGQMTSTSGVAEKKCNCG